MSFRLKMENTGGELMIPSSSSGSTLPPNECPPENQTYFEENTFECSSVGDLDSVSSHFESDILDDDDDNDVNNVSDSEVNKDTAVKNNGDNDVYKVMEDTYSEKYMYYFDYPGLCESGYVETSPNNITIKFPEKKNVTLKDEFCCNQDVMMFINNQQLFAYQWLPIYTVQDFYKVKDIFNRCYFEYSKLTNWNHFENAYCFSTNHNDKITNYNKQSFKLSCFENLYCTSIDILIPITTTKHTYFSSIEVQIYIGTNLIFNNKRDFKNMLSVHDVYFLTNFILNKLNKL